MTKEEYLFSRRTNLDHLLFYSWVPFVFNFIPLFIAGWNESYEGMKVFGLLEIPFLILVVSCRSYLGWIEAKRTMDWYKMNDKK